MSLGLVIEPLEEAVKRMDRKSPVAQALSHEEWAEVPLALRERAFWSANFARADMLQVMHDMIGERLSLERRESVPGRGEVLVSRDNFIVEMRERLRTSGYLPPAGKEGSLQDMTSTGRLGLIYDFNTQQAQEFARWKAGQDEGALDAFPAQELFRAEDRVVPRDWLARWAEAGGKLHDGRMIARKDDPIWMAISAFGTPFPPFDFNSGMDLRDIDRREAEELGVIAPGDEVTPPQVGFNDALEKSVEGYAPEIRKALLSNLGPSAVVKDGMAAFQPAGTPPTAQASGPTGTPVSSAVELNFKTAAQADKARRHLETIDAVHGDGLLEPIPFSGKVSKGSFGTYYPGYSSGRAIGVAPTANPCTLAHEVGHWLDHIAIKSSTTFASEDPASVLAPVMKAIDASPEIALLKAGEANASTYNLQRHHSYLLSERERWARAYAQFIATESKDPDMEKWLRDLRGRSADQFRHRHWDEETFAPIAAEIRAAFTTLGWMR